MRSETVQFSFRSDLFPVDPREDEETNPFCYGKELAAWLSDKFRAAGYTPEPVIPEDWGWCVMIERKPFMLWVGCGNDPSEFYESVKPEDKPNFVPQADQLVVEARVAPVDIDQIVMGAPVQVRIQAGNQRTTPSVIGKVTHISADLTRESASAGQPSQAYFLTRVSLNEDSLKSLGDLKLVPGMPAEALIAAQGTLKYGPRFRQSVQASLLSRH